MTYPQRLVGRVALCALFCLSISLAAAAGRPISETDIFSFQWIANPSISPDGAQIVYVHVQVNSKHDGYDTSLWIIPSGGGTARQLTSGPRDSTPRWSPDGKLLAFTRAIEKEGKVQPPQVYLLAMEGGEARPLTEMTQGASGPMWSPDGHSIAFSSNTLPGE